VSRTARNSTLGKLFAVALALLASAPDARAQDAEAVPPVAETTQDYGELLRQTGSLNTYNRQMERLVASQRKEMATIEEELTRIDDVSQGITPLMLRMVEALEAFVELDIPFNIEERRERIEKLRDAMDAAKLSDADRYRRILQAYQIENEYGRTIEAYRSTLERDGRELTVDYLRVGRTALIYQTLDESEAGVWSREGRSWEVLDSSHRRAIRRGLRIARRQAAPDLIQIPLPAATPLGGGA
jgi:hypothetical protein